MPRFVLAVSTLAGISVGPAGVHVCDRAYPLEGGAGV